MFLSKQTSQPKLDVFQELLSKHPNVFHPSRSPKSLLVHWQLLKQYYLLDDQSGEFSLPGGSIQIPVDSLVIEQLENHTSITHVNIRYIDHLCGFEGFAMTF